MAYLGSLDPASGYDRACAFLETWDVPEMVCRSTGLMDQLMDLLIPAFPSRRVHGRVRGGSAQGL